ncbi:ATP-dependent DNA helicase UvrD2 [soil metagenome]
MEADDLLKGLDEQQRAAVESLLGPTCLLAGAGTGKTRAITHRIAYGIATGVYAPNRVLALTFTSRAAGELRGRLRRLGATGVHARTFHSAALAQLNFFWPTVVGGSLPSIVETKGRLLAQAAEGIRLKLDTATLRDLAAEVEWRKVSRLTLDQYAELLPGRALPPAVDADAMLALHRAYEDLKDQTRRIDFKDVLLAAAGMIEAEPRVAQQVRERYRFFVVDEYQDVSPLQQALLELWLGDREDLCVVGDASQTIYSFAGASAEFLVGFPTRYREATVTRLERNYRSSPQIVHLANRLMRARPAALSLQSAQPAAGGPAPTIDSYPSEAAEARSIALAIAEEIAGGTRPQDIAVLYRINAQGAAIETALADAGVAFQVRGSSRFFEQQEVKQAMMLLKGALVAAQPDPLFKTVSDVLRGLGWTQQPPEARGAVRERWESLNAIMALADSAPRGTTLRQFVDELNERAAVQHEPTMSTVTLATLHSAKGLEWESVHLAGLSEGYLPITYATDEDAIEEERRLLYVGITRARRRLALSWAVTGSGRGAERSPSRFLADLR